LIEVKNPDQGINLIKNIPVLNNKRVSIKRNGMSIGNWINQIQSNTNHSIGFQLDLAIVW